MKHRFAVRFIFAILAIALLVGVGMSAYHMGVAHGLAAGGQLAAPGTHGRGMAFWPGPWGFFPWFPFFPLIGILFLLLVFRGLFWWGRGGWACGRYPSDLDEWHRRAHASSAPSGQGPAHTPEP
jgi:hypothetical protein